MFKLIQIQGGAIYKTNQSFEKNYKHPRHRHEVHNFQIESSSLVPLIERKTMDLSASRILSPASEYINMLQEAIYVQTSHFKSRLAGRLLEKFGGKRRKRFN